MTKKTENGKFSLPDHLKIDGKRAKQLEKFFFKTIKKNDTVSGILTEILKEVKTKEESMYLSFNFGCRYEHNQDPLLKLAKLLR